MTRFGSAMERIDERIPGIDLPLMSVSQTRGVIRRSEITDAPQRAASLDAYKVCRVNDVVFNRMSIRAGAMGIANEDGLVTYEYEVMRPCPGIDSGYIVYLMKSSWFRSELIKRERGIGAGDQANVRTTRVSFSELRTINAYIPSPTEQREIAAFLDRETAQIDTLIAEQQHLIEILKERRKAAVRHAMDPDPTWKSFRIKHVASVKLGKKLDGGRNVGASEVMTPYVRAADVLANGTVNLDGLNKMPFLPEEIQRLNLHNGDILVIEGGATVGRPAHLSCDVPGVGFQMTVNRVRVNDKTSSRFIYWMLYSMYEAEYFTNYYGAVSFIHLTTEKLREIPSVLPPLEVQKKIAVRLDRETSRIDTLIAESEKLIELSRERRSALITAAVTGQIDIPQEV